MTTEPKPFASLSSGLLARKGAARPAMRPQGFGQAGNGLEDLGWDDMGFEPPKPTAVARDASHDAFGEDVVQHPRSHPTGLTPVQSPVHNQQAEIAERINDLAEPDEDEAVEPIESVVEFVAEGVENVENDQVSDPVEAETSLVFEPSQSEPVETTADEPFAGFRESPLLMRAPVSIAAPRRFSKPRSAPGSKGKAAFTLRLEPDRHLKLRLACAVDGRSAQQLVTDALDQLLGRMPELESLVAKAKRKG